VSGPLTTCEVKQPQPDSPPSKANFKFQISNEKLRIGAVLAAIFHFEFEIRNLKFLIPGGAR
jgi:hypothetical protein